MSSFTSAAAPSADRRWRETSRPFIAIVRRDLRVLREGAASFAVRTLLQPVLMLFTFTYVLPRLDLSPVGGGGSGAGEFGEVLVPGVVGAVILVQAMQVLALPLFMELDNGDLEDRLCAPLSIGGLAAAKMVAGGLQILIAAALVLPLAYVIPANDVHLEIQWVTLVPLLVLCSFVGAAAGLAVGVRMTMAAAAPFFSVVTIPVTFLGAMYYPWSALEDIRWLQIAVLVNPLVYVNEGLRATMTSSPHLSLAVVSVALAGWGILALASALRTMRRRLVE